MNADKLKYPYPTAFVDFASEKPLRVLAQELSCILFAGIPFVGEGSGLWDEVPAVRLERRFLGFQVELGGTEGERGGIRYRLKRENFLGMRNAMAISRPG